MESQVFAVALLYLIAPSYATTASPSAATSPLEDNSIGNDCVSTTFCFMNKILNSTLERSLNESECFLNKMEWKRIRLEVSLPKSCTTNDSGEECCFDPCHANACYNNGTCTERKEPESNVPFECDCGEKFKGERCEECIPECEENAYCTSSGCVCMAGFEGNEDGSDCTPYCKRELFRTPLKCEGTNSSILTFEKTGVHFTAYSVENCSSGRPYASIRCIQTTEFDVTIARFDESSITCLPCDEDLGTVIEKARSLDDGKIKDNVTSDEIERDFEALKLGTKKENLTVSEVSATMNFIMNLSKVLGSKKSLMVNKKTLEDLLDIAQNLDEQLNTEDAKKYSATGQIENIPQERGQDKTLRQLLQSLGEVIDTVARGVEVTDGSADVIVGGVSVTIRDINTEDGKYEDFEIKVESYLEGDANYQVLTKVTRVFIDHLSVGAMAKDVGGNLRLVFVLFRDASHLTVDKRTGQVVQGNYKGERNTEAIPIPITINIDFFLRPLPTEQQYDAISGYLLELHTEYFCVFWDYKHNEWSDVGCAYEGPKQGKNHSTCTCNHFTSFALLLRTTTRLKEFKPSYFNIIALSISTGCLTITAAIYLIVKDLRTRRPTPILLNICVNLILGYLLFLVGINGRSKDFSNVLCYTTAALMHITFLASWFWTFIYALNMYYALVKVIGHGGFVGKKIFMYIVGYGCPIAIVAADLTASLLIDKHNPPQLNDENFLETYISSHVCWLHNYSMYVGFAAPVGILLISNCIMFFFIMKSLSSRKIQSTRDTATAAQQVYTGITMMTMMGLTWIFGYLMLFSSDELYQTVLSYTFDVINTSQGTIIFLVSCIRQQAVRVLWLHPLMRVLGCKGKNSYPDGKQSLTDSTAASKSAVSNKPSRAENLYTASTPL